LLVACGRPSQQPTRGRRWRGLPACGRRRSSLAASCRGWRSQVGGERSCGHYTTRNLEKTQQTIKKKLDPCRLCVRKTGDDGERDLGRGAEARLLLGIWMDWGPSARQRRRSGSPMNGSPAGHAWFLYSRGAVAGGAV
jgi:hypothetical protein